MEKSTELEKVFFSILFIGTIWEAVNQLNRAFRLLDKGIEGKIQQDGRQTCLSQAKGGFSGHLWDKLFVGEGQVAISETQA